MADQSPTTSTADADPSVWELMDGTDTEKNLADDFVALFGKLSAVTGAVEDGNWYRAWEKIHSVRSALDDLERRITTVTEVDGEPNRVFAAPDADATRVRQLIIAFAQQYGGDLGRKVFPVGELENETAKAKIARSQEWQIAFRAASAAGDADAMSALLGGSTVRIVDGMSSGGGR